MQSHKKLLHDNYTFRKMCNEQRYKVNSQVIDKLRHAETLTQRVRRNSQSEAADNAISKLSEDLDIPEHRLKCIRLGPQNMVGRLYLSKKLTLLPF